MKRKIIGILVCMMLIITALPVLGAVNPNGKNKEKFNSISSDDEYGDLVISVYIRMGKPGEIWVDNAEVTATHIETGQVFNVEYREHEIFEGYWLTGPVGDYNIEAKRGLWRGSIQDHMWDGLSFGFIDLKFFKDKNFYHEPPFLSILRLIFEKMKMM